MIQLLGVLIRVTSLKKRFHHLVSQHATRLTANPYQVDLDLHSRETESPRHSQHATRLTANRDCLSKAVHGMLLL